MFRTNFCPKHRFLLCIDFVCNYIVERRNILTFLLFQNILICLTIFTKVFYNFFDMPDLNYQRQYISIYILVIIKLLSLV